MVPLSYYAFPCPDLFRWGEGRMLVPSESRGGMVTHYCTSDTLAGPWLAPTNDRFDGGAYCAAKTASDGVRRFAFGWVPTYEGETDGGKWEWGGRIVRRRPDDIYAN